MSRITDTPAAQWLILGGVIVGAVVLWRLARAGAQVAQAGAGAITGNNAVTHSATNAAGVPTTAYVGAGVAGTIGATANAASGGVLASLGEWIGGKVFELTHDTDPPPATAAPTNSATQPSGWDYTGSGQSFADLSAAEGWYPWGAGTPLGQIRGM